MLVCVRILVRLAASDQTDPGPGRGKINLVGEREQNVKNVQQKGMKGEEERRRWDRRTPKAFTPNSSSRAYVPARTGPAFCSNSNSTHSQTEINRILRYTQLSTKIFAQMIAARRLQMIAGGCECKKPAKGGRDNRAGVCGAPSLIASTSVPKIRS